VDLGIAISLQGNDSVNSYYIVVSHGSRREHSFPITPVLRVTNLLRPLPSNDRCLQSHYLATAVV
jgi:hypothetical protein